MKPLLSLVLSICALAGALPRAADVASPVGIVEAARSQVGKTVRYDPSYRTLEYPNGDVPIATGVCTDVVIRALRVSRGLDLQQLVHEDMKRAFTNYPTKWGLKAPNPNIDHRRVLNLQVFFKRMGWEVPVTKNARDYQAGDFVTCTVGFRQPHIMIVSDRTNSIGRPLVLHNIGVGTKEEDCLFDFKITGHYRMKPEARK